MRTALFHLSLEQVNVTAVEISPVLSRQEHLSCCRRLPWLPLVPAGKCLHCTSMGLKCLVPAKTFTGYDSLTVLLLTLLTLYSL